MSDFKNPKCFHSSFTIPEKQKIRPTLERTFLVDVDIIAGKPEADEKPRHHSVYRIHSKFNNPNHGMQMLVMLDQMIQLEVDVDEGYVAPTSFL